MKANISPTVAKHAVPLAQATLWQCEGCSSFVAIQSSHPITEPICPVCGSPRLELCCHLPTILGCEYGEA